MTKKPGNWVLVISAILLSVECCCVSWGPASISNSPSGIGTSTGNGIIGKLYQPCGKRPAPQDSVFLRPCDYLPEIKVFQKRGTMLPTIVFSTCTDDSGNYQFQSIPDGLYTCEARDTAHNRVMMDSIRIDNSMSAPIPLVDTLKPSSTITGIVPLGNDSAKAYIQAFGLDLYAIAAADGSFSLNNVPAGNLQLRVSIIINSNAEFDTIAIVIKAGIVISVDTSVWCYRTIAYDGNGNSAGKAPVDKKRYNPDEKAVVLGNTGNLEKTGLVFAGWTTKKDGGGAWYRPGDSIVMTSRRMTLFADWTSNKVAMVEAGGNQSFIVKTDGSIWAWGYNGNGALGDGTTTNRYIPVLIVARGVQSVVCGDLHTLIVKTDGSLWACGDNRHGQFGDGTKTGRYTPVQMIASDVQAVAAGYNYTVILKTNGSLWTCGNNSSGQLGDGSTTDKTTPVQILPSGVQSVAAGWAHTLIIMTDGLLWTCGWDAFGQLGDGVTNYYSFSLIQILPAGVQSVVGGYFHTLFVLSDGSLWGCGYNAFGQLGDGTTTDKSMPVQILTGGVRSVAAGTNFTLIEKTDGSLWTCGDNSNGQLATGDTLSRSSPVQILAGGVQSVAAGWNSTLIVKTDGSLWACGDNQFGQLGDGTWTDRHVPVQIFLH